MNSKLPLDALRTFVHIVRTGSYSAAAADLNLTAGAVSQRIAGLEDHLGTRLFRKSGRTMILTEAGHSLLDEVQKPFEQIESALEKNHQPRLKIHVTPAFGQTWLMPRFCELQEAIPDVSVAVEMSAVPTNLRLSLSIAEFAIRYSEGPHPPLASVPLVTPDLLLVVANSIANDHDLNDIAGLVRNLPLISQPNTKEWRDWFAALAIREGEIRWGPSLNEDAGAIAAAANGLGIASIRSVNLAIRQDIVPVARLKRSIGTYSLVASLGAMESSAGRALSRWLTRAFSCEVNCARANTVPVLECASSEKTI